MTVTELVERLKGYDGSFRVLVNHDDATEPQYIPAEDGCPAYISLESEI